MPQHKMKEHRIQDTQIAVFVPGADNELKLEVAKASLKGGQLVVKFNDRLPAQAIQRMIANDLLMCVTLVPYQMVEEYEAPAENPADPNVNTIDTITEIKENKENN